MLFIRCVRFACKPVLNKAVLQLFKNGLICTRSSSWWWISKNTVGAWFSKLILTGAPEAKKIVRRKKTDGKPVKSDVHSETWHLLQARQDDGGIFHKVFEHRVTTRSWHMMKTCTTPTWHLWWWPDVRSLLGDSRGTDSPPSGWGPKIECLPFWPAWTLGSCGILPIRWRSCSVNTERSELAAFEQQRSK